MWPYPPKPPAEPEPPRDPQPIIDALGKPEQADQPPELGEQYADLLHTVWDSERRERMNDRIDAAVGIEVERERAKKRGRKKRK